MSPHRPLCLAPNCTRVLNHRGAHGPGRGRYAGPRTGKHPRPLPTTPDDAADRLVAIGGTGEDERPVVVTMSTVVGVVAKVQKLQNRKAAKAAKEPA